MAYSVPVIKKYTSIYTRYGNLFVLGCFIVVAVIIMIKLAGQVVRKKAEGRK